jgi:hypothetical protein
MAKETKPNPDKYNQKFVELMPSCFYCKHLTALGEQDSEARWSCRAYPEGIPYGIWARHIKHTEVLPAQEGKYTFESKVYEWPDGKQVISFEGEWSSV